MIYLDQRANYLRYTCLFHLICSYFQRIPNRSMAFSCNCSNSSTEMPLIAAAASATRRHMRCLISLPTIRVRCQIWSICFDEKPVQSEPSPAPLWVALAFLNVIGPPKERWKPISRQLLGSFPAARERVHHTTNFARLLFTENSYDILMSIPIMDTIGMFTHAPKQFVVGIRDAVSSFGEVSQ